MSIKKHEILKGNTLPQELLANYNKLFIRINTLRNMYGRPMIVTSGYRTAEDHYRIYKSKGISDIHRIPMGSKHLTCEAVDFSDPQGVLQNFIVNHVEQMEEIGLWFEDFYYTRGWVHCQIAPPSSGNRFFIP